jgi:hypothetical protein
MIYPDPLPNLFFDIGNVIFTRGQNHQIRTYCLIKTIENLFLYIAAALSALSLILYFQHLILYKSFRMHNAARREDNFAVRYLRSVEDVDAVEAVGYLHAVEDVHAVEAVRYLHAVEDVPACR